MKYKLGAQVVIYPQFLVYVAFTVVVNIYFPVNRWQNSKQEDHDDPEQLLTFSLNFLDTS